MKKLSKTQSAELLSRGKTAREALDALNAEIGTFNAAMVEAWAKVETALTVYTDAISEAQAFCEGIASDIESHIDEKSDAWRGGDRGSAYSDWLTEWQLSLDEPSLSQPDEIEEVDEDAITSVENLPEEPNI